MGRLAEFGILSDYLDKNCDKSSLKLCNYRESIKEMDGAGFIWSGKIISQTDGIQDTDGEYRKIIREIFKDKTYIKEFSYQSFREFLILIINPEIGPEFWSFTQGSWPFEMVKHHYPDLFKQYTFSLQFKSLLKYDNINNYQFYVLMISYTLLFFYFFYSKRQNVFNNTNYSNLLNFTIIIFVLSNTFFCGVFSGSYTRYQFRAVWIIVLIAFLITMKNLEGYFEKKQFPWTS